MKRLTRWMSAGLLCLMCLGATQPPRDPVTELPPPDFVEFLAARELLIEGRVLAVVDTVRTPACSCGIAGLGPYPVTMVHVQVTRVVSGTADDSVLAVAIMDRRQDVAPGNRILAWAFHDCHDDWKLWGDYCLLGGDGEIRVPASGDPANYKIRGLEEAPVPSWKTVESTMIQRGLKSSVSFFDGCGAVALLRVRDVLGRGTPYVVYECDSVGWVLGNGHVVPSRIECRRVPDCFPGVFRGDSIVVPLGTSFRGDTLIIQGCPSAFRVKQGHAAQWGLPLRELRRALRSDGSSYFVRKVLDGQ